MSDDPAKRVGWGALLQGHSFDLEDWESALKPPFDPWVVKEEEGLILRSQLLDPAFDSSTAYERGKALIEQINGALGVSHRARNVTLDRIFEILGDGSRRGHVFLHVAGGDLRLKMRATAEVIGSDGKPKPQPPQQSDPQRWLALAAEDDLLADALTYFARGEDWFDMYKALECLILRFGRSESEFLRLEWADKAEVERLKRTANFERHARRKFDPPPKPMPQAEARDLLVRLMMRAFAEAATEASPEPP